MLTAVHEVVVEWNRRFSVFWSSVDGQGHVVST